MSKRKVTGAQRHPGHRKYTRAGYTRPMARGRMPYSRAAARRGRRIANRSTAGFLGMELKFYDTSLSSHALTSPSDATGGECNPSATVNFTTIAQGDGEENRDGRKVTVKSVFINGTIKVPLQTNQTATEGAAVVFLALVHDTQTNGAQLDSESVYTNKVAASSGAASPMRNLKFSSRFRVLATRRFALEQPQVVYDGTNIEQGGYEKPFVLSWRGNMNIIYKATTSDVANITDNSIQLICFCSNTATGPLLNYNARTRFVG